MDGAAASYQERLWPGPLLWLLCVGAGLALGIAYGKVIGLLAGSLVALVGTVLAMAVVAATSPLVRVDARVVRAGRARLPLEHVGQVLVLDAAGMAMARGPQGDASAHLVTRIGIPGGILIEVVDQQDPHHTWVVASRRPVALSGAVEAARGKVFP